MSVGLPLHRVLCANGWGGGHYMRPLRAACVQGSGVGWPWLCACNIFLGCVWLCVSCPCLCPSVCACCGAAPLLSIPGCTRCALPPLHAASLSSVRSSLFLCLRYKACEGEFQMEGAGAGDSSAPPLAAGSTSSLDSTTAGLDTLGDTAMSVTVAPAVSPAGVLPSMSPTAHSVLAQQLSSLTENPIATAVNGVLTTLAEGAFHLGNVLPLGGVCCYRTCVCGRVRLCATLFAACVVVAHV